MEHQQQYQEDDEQVESLIHLPLISLETLLSEQDHPLADNYSNLWDVDARELFDSWAVRRGYAAKSPFDDSVSEGHEAIDGKEGSGRNLRRLQEVAGDGTHFVKLYAGNPAQVRVLALSSGSDFTAWPCEDCYNCGTISQPFFQSQSNTFTTMPCGRCASATDTADACDSSRATCIVSGNNPLDSSSKWTAYESRDYIYVGGAEADLQSMGVSDPTGTDAAERYGFALVFGCQTEAMGWYATQVHDGIAGMSSAKTSFVNQMVFQDKLKYPRFTMCFEKGTSDGMVTLGGFNPKTLDSPMVYVQNEETEGKKGFKVFVRNVYLRKGGGQSVVSDGDSLSTNLVKLNFDANAFNAGNGGTIIDSGLPLLVFDESIQESFLMEWKRMVGQDFSFGKMMLTEEDVLNLPTVILQIKAHDGVDKSFDPKTVPSMAGARDPQNPFDVMIAIPAAHYLEYIPATGIYRSKITLDSKIGSFIGIVAMEGHAYYYDLTADRIGMAESFSCQPKSGMSGFGDDDMFALPNIQSSAGLDPWGNPLGTGNGPWGTRGVEPPSKAHYDQYGGTCTSATCISFVTVGYCTVLVALAAVYKKYKPKDQSKKWDQEYEGDTEGFGRESESLNPEFNQRIRHGNVEGFA